jgi:hypothetical protein
MSDELFAKMSFLCITEFEQELYQYLKAERAVIKAIVADAEEWDGDDTWYFRNRIDEIVDPDD